MTISCFLEEPFYLTDPDRHSVSSIRISCHLYRNENFNDKDGYRSGLTYTAASGGTGIIGNPVAQRLKSNTLTVGFSPMKNMELRCEVRFDKSSQNAFLQSNGAGKNSQNTYALDAVYQF